MHVERHVLNSFIFAVHFQHPPDENIQREYELRKNENVHLIQFTFVRNWIDSAALKKVMDYPAQLE